MPYEEYLASCSFSPYIGQTFSDSGSQSTSYVSISILSFSSGGNGIRGAGVYSYSASNIITGRRSGPFDPPFEENGTNGETRSFSSTISLGANTARYSGIEDYTASAAGKNFGDPYNNNAGSTRSEVASLTINSDGSYIVSGAGTYTTFYQNTDARVGSSTTYPITNFPNIDYVMLKKTTTTTLAVDIRKTSEENATYYGPLEDSEATYSRMITTMVPNTFSSIKRTINSSAVITGYGNISNTVNIEWLGYSSGGAQNLGLVYTTTGASKNISPYDKIMMETDSFSSSNQRESFNYGSGFTDSFVEDTYTLTYDTITTSEVASQTTTLERASISNINSFIYGFIKTNTADTTIYTAGTSTESVELTSASKGFVYTFDSNFFAVSGVSYTAVQAISTTSNFTQFVELSGLGKATSFIVRSFVTITASFIYRNNAFGITSNFAGPLGSRYTFAPVFPESALVIRSPEQSNPDTFYTEEASFASFAEPDYSTAYKNYSPEDCSLVFLALIALNTEGSGGGVDGAKYPSWISVYNGTFAGDRAITSNESVTVYQSSSYVGSGATNVYQTITYFINNNASSQTTKTTSIAMALANEASSVSRLARTAVENLDSAYISYLLPSLKLVAANVFFTQGLQGDASYNIDKLLLNAYTTAKSTFAGSATSSFPVSISEMPYPIYRNKIRIDSAYGGAVPFNSLQIGLLRYTSYYTEFGFIL